MIGSPSSLREKPVKPRLDDLDRRRRVVEVLNDRSTPVTERELATELAGGPEPWREDAREEARIYLRHVDLPRLADAGLVAWDEPDGTVTSAAEPPVDGSRFERATGTPDDRGDDVVGDASVERRRAAMTVLESRDGPQERADLAREVAALEADGEPAIGAVEAVEVALHHVHLPKLERAGRLEYDAEEGMVSRDDSGRPP